jgi:hypothetical protein
MIVAPGLPPARGTANPRPADALPEAILLLRGAKTRRVALEQAHRNQEHGHESLPDAAGVLTHHRRGRFAAEGFRELGRVAYHAIDPEFPGRMGIGLRELTRPGRGVAPLRRARRLLEEANTRLASRTSAQDEIDRPVLARALIEQALSSARSNT